MFRNISFAGKTLYVEPVSIIEPTNELKRLESRYKQEEHRILLGMCQCIAAHLVEITAAVHAVAQIDVISAKAKLGRKLNGIIPLVQFVIACLYFARTLMFSLHYLLHSLCNFIFYLFFDFPTPCCRFLTKVAFDV